MRKLILALPLVLMACAGNNLTTGLSTITADAYCRDIGSAAADIGPKWTQLTAAQQNRVVAIRNESRPLCPTAANAFPERSEANTEKLRLMRDEMKLINEGVK
jgi:phospholipase/lecithinase/hemolysin